MASQWTAVPINFEFPRWEGKIFWVDKYGVRHQIAPSIAPSSGGPNTISAPGAWTVPAAMAIGQVIFPTGSYTAIAADNGSVATGPAIGIIVQKPTATTATVVYQGEVTNAVGLGAGLQYYLGANGGLILKGAVPSVLGTIVQPIGVAHSATNIIVNFAASYILE